MTGAVAVLAAVVGSTLALASPGAQAQEHQHEPAAASAGGHQSPAGTEAHAGSGHDEHHSGFDATAFAAQLVNLGVVAFILAYFGGRAVNRALATRHEQIRNELAAASKLKTEAEERLREHDRRLANLETEAAAIREGAKKEADSERARLVALAEQRARRIGEETAFLLDQQIKEAELALRRQVADAVLAVAQRLLEKSVDANDQQRLLETFVGDVGKAN